MSFILAVALSVTLALIIIGLVMGLLYYKWRNTELLTGLGEFLRENNRLRQQISDLQRTKLQQCDQQQSNGMTNENILITMLDQ